MVTPRQIPKQATSRRHATILDDYKQGKSIYQEWTRHNLGEITIRDWSWGKVTLDWKMDDRFIMPDGVMFGGFIACVGDHFAALGAMTVLSEEKERFRTSRLATDYFRPLKKPSARVEVNVPSHTRTLIHVDADIFNAHDKLAARIHAVQVRRMTG